MSFTQASMTQLLRTCLAKSAKEAATALPPLVRAKDTTKLKKHLSLVLERLSKVRVLLVVGLVRAVRYAALIDGCCTTLDIIVVRIVGGGRGAP